MAKIRKSYKAIREAHGGDDPSEYTRRSWNTDQRASYRHTDPFDHKYGYAKEPKDYDEFDEKPNHKTPRTKLKPKKVLKLKSNNSKLNIYLTTRYKAETAWNAFVNKWKYSYDIESGHEDSHMPRYKEYKAEYDEIRNLEREADEILDDLKSDIYFPALKEYYTSHKLRAANFANERDYDMIVLPYQIASSTVFLGFRMPYRDDWWVIIRDDGEIPEELCKLFENIEYKSYSDDKPNVKTALMEYCEKYGLKFVSYYKDDNEASQYS